MAEIKIMIGSEEWSLNGSNVQWQLGRYKDELVTDKKTGKSEMKSVFNPEKYFGNLQWALLSIAEWKLRVSDVTTLSELLNEMKILRKEVCELYSMEGDSSRDSHQPLINSKTRKLAL